MDNGICHKCGGAGKVWGKWIIRTPEYEAKLEARRQAKAAKAAEEREAKRLAEYADNCAETLRRHGFTPDGFTYVFLNASYNDRETLKQAHVMWDAILGWHSPAEVPGFQFLRVSYSDVAEFTPWGGMAYKEGISETVEELKRKEYDRLNGLKDSEFFGKIGDKIEISATYNFSARFEVKSFMGYGHETMFIHNFRDDTGNVFVWKTSCGLNIAAGRRVTVKGTVKEHSEYKNQKQTVLNRCKVTESK